MAGNVNPAVINCFRWCIISIRSFLAGSARNIYFPFDIVNDTPSDVALEMVKELEITDWEPYEIAEMIDGEISALVPLWKKSDFPRNEAYSTFNFQEDDDGSHHPFYSFSSCSSSQVSLSGLMTRGGDWLQGMALHKFFVLHGTPLHKLDCQSYTSCSGVVDMLHPHSTG